MSEAKHTPPFAGQAFKDKQHWVNKASSWLTCHPEYNNTEHHPKEGWRGNHFTAMCFDAKGRRVRNGGDFRRAEEDQSFPVWWIWPDQIPGLILSSTVKDALITELLEALKGLVARLEDEDGEGPMLQIGSALGAIAKAEGRSP